MARLFAWCGFFAAALTVAALVAEDHSTVLHDAFVKKLIDALSYVKEDGGGAEDMQSCGMAVNHTMQNLNSEYGSAESTSATLRNACDHLSVYGDFGGDKWTCQPVMNDLAAELGGERNYAAWCEQATTMISVPAQARETSAAAQVVSGVSTSSAHSSKVVEAKEAMKAIEEKRARGEDIHDDVERLKVMLNAAERENQRTKSEDVGDRESQPQEPVASPQAPQQEPDARSDTDYNEEDPIRRQRQERHSRPKPYGHTSQVSPHNGARDQEWYVEGRWDKGSEPPVQDGVITERPARVAVPPGYYDGARALPMRNKRVNSRARDDDGEDERDEYQERRNQNKVMRRELEQREDEAAMRRSMERQRVQQERQREQQEQQQGTDLRVGQASWGHKEGGERDDAPAAMDQPAAVDQPQPVAAQTPAQPVAAQTPAASGAGGGDSVLPWGNVDAMAGGQEVMQRRPFGQENRGTHLTKASVDEGNAMVDQIERAQAAEEKRASYRALTHLRGMMTSTYDSSANTHLQNIDEYNHKRKWRDNHPVRHLAEEEADVGRWAYPDGGEPDNQPLDQPGPR